MIRHVCLFVVAITLLAACGGPPAAVPPTPAPAPTGAPAPDPTAMPATAAPAPAVAPSAFPRTIEHKYGSTTIPAEPKRVIALGFSEVDPILALGVVPVAVRDWFGDQPDAVWPWSHDKLGGATPMVLKMPFGELNYETLAALTPDLIVATHSGITDKEYATLAAIAPTLAQTGDAPDFGMPWQAQTELIGRALGREAQARELVSAVEAEIAAARAAHPELEGKQVAWASPAQEAGSFWVVGPATPPMRFLRALGLVYPDAVAEIVGDKDSVQISSERLDLLDHDLLISYAESDATLAAMEQSPILQQLDVVSSGHWIVFEAGDPVYGALSYSTVSSLRYALTELVPRISAALERASPAAAAPTFPVTIAHKYGSTAITSEPQRIVTVGLTEQDALLALGITPVGTTEWFGGYPGAVWPWAKDRLGDTVPEVVGDAATINFEKIAALKPDLILALYSGITQEQYDLLTQIAPTVAQPKAYVDYGIPWQELTHTVGLAVGKAAEADALVARVEQRFAQARADHPGFSGARALVATPYEGIWVYGPEDVRGRLLTAMGFTLPEGLAEITGAQFGGNLSMERADLLDVDVIIWLDADEAKGPLGGPLYASLAVHTEAREVFLSSSKDPLGGATSFVSVLSLPFLLDGLVPQLAAAVDGDPSTKVVASTP